MLAHELGHEIGMLQDLYYFASGWNCYELDIATCGFYPSDFFCQPSEAHYGNMMYFANSTPWTPVDWYHLSYDDLAMNTPMINSQAENAAYFQTNYPDNFKEM